jgi:hypothetical protein
MPMAVDPLVRQLEEQLADQGGFTLDHRSGRWACAGLAVCAEPGLTLRFSWPPWPSEVVHDWVARGVGYIERRPDAELHLGGWFDAHTQTVSLDVVRVVPATSVQRVRAIGRRHGQTAFFDLAAGSVRRLAAG